MGILYALIKIPATGPSLVVRQLHVLGGKRLQRTCASKLRDDGWEKECIPFLLL